RVAIDYSSRDAIARMAAAAFAGKSAPDIHTATPMLAAAMTDATDVDLLIRPGGEKRLSDFLLWESAYAELVFTDRMWPEFNEGDLDCALEEFHRRERRFGGLSASTAYAARVHL